MYHYMVHITGNQSGSQFFHTMKEADRAFDQTRTFGGYVYLIQGNFRGESRFGREFVLDVRQFDEEGEEVQRTSV